MFWEADEASSIVHLWLSELHVVSPFGNWTMLCGNYMHVSLCILGVGDRQSKVHIRARPFLNAYTLTTNRIFHIFKQNGWLTIVLMEAIHFIVVGLYIKIICKVMSHIMILDYLSWWRELLFGVNDISDNSSLLGHLWRIAVCSKSKHLVREIAHVCGFIIKSYDPALCEVESLKDSNDFGSSRDR